VNYALEGKALFIGNRRTSTGQSRIGYLNE
jgi:hypothetical protein